MGQTGSKVHHYSKAVTEPTETESAIYRCATHPDSLISHPKSGAMTLQEIFLHNFNSEPDREFLGLKVQRENESKPHYEYLTWRQVEEKVKMIGTAITKFGLAPEKQQYKDFKCKFVGIQARNSIEWILTDIACMCYGFTTMPLYDTLGEEAVKCMFEETEMETLFVTADLLKLTLKRMKEGKCPFLKNIVVFDDEKMTDEDKGLLKDINWYPFSQFYEQFKETVIDYPKVTPDDIAFFSYTSGTTGRPKGAIMTHRNCVALLGGAEHTLYYLNSDSVHLSYLPLAHVFEKAVYLTMVMCKAKYTVYGGDMNKLKEDLELVRPTFFCSVPRLLNKFHDMISKKIAEQTGVSGFLARQGLKSKIHKVETSGGYTATIYDALIFRKTKALLGGRCEFILSSSAPLSLGVKKLLKAAFCCPIIEGYGQTEGMGGQFVQDLDDPDLETVGGPLPMNEFKLVDVPEMGYTHRDVDEAGNLIPRGEIWIRGPNIIPGYYKNDAKNKESFEDGWLKSGDIGMIVPGSNALKVIDRKKNIFKLAHGEYVAPEKLEQVYKNTPAISEIFIYGNSVKSVLVAVANLDEKAALSLAQTHGIQAADFQELCFKPEMIDVLRKELRKTADQNHLKGFERIADIFVDPKPFSDSDLITTTFKLKREQATKFYKDKIAQLYEGKD